MALRLINEERRNAAIRAKDVQLNNIRQQVLTALSELQNIQNNNSITNAQAVTYIKIEAEILQKLIKYVFGQVV